MEWSQVLQDPVLKELPYKIELNEDGHIVMSPASNLHGYLQSRLVMELAKKNRRRRHPCRDEHPDIQERQSSGCMLASSQFIEKFGFETPYPKAPELCIEVRSPSNTEREMSEKIELYLAKGALEVWICDSEGLVRFFCHEGEIAESRLVPRFSTNIRV
jgi:Uma2 family endonuclease